jgi:undecaprenyl-diphosphatase
MLRRLWRAETAYIVGFVLFALLSVIAHFNAYFDSDVELSRQLQSYDSRSLALLMRGVSVFGNHWYPFALAGATLLWFLFKRMRNAAIVLLISAGGGDLLNRIIKFIVARPRPSNALVLVQTNARAESFPSGHVTFYVCYFGFLFLLAYALLPKRSFRRRAAMVASALPVLLIGLSRVYLGAHWPSDVVGAYLFGGLWLMLSLEVYRRLEGNE